MTRNEKRLLELEIRRMTQHLRVVQEEAQHYQEYYQGASSEAQTFLRGLFDVTKFTTYKAAAQDLYDEAQTALQTYMEADEP